MQKNALKVLEYGKILDMLEERAGSIVGKELCRELFPKTKLDEVLRALDETSEACLIEEMSGAPLGGVYDIRKSLKKVSMNGTLTPDELLEIMNTMYAMRKIKRFFKDTEIEAPILKSWAVGIEILGELERAIENTVDEHGAIRDDASVTLSRIRRESKAAKSRIGERVQNVLHSAEYQKFFQDAIVTVRGDRYVLPVKQEYRKDFPGIVHDQSATGSTLFIEPMAIVELNNEAKRLTLEEAEEIRRILRELSRRIEKHGDALSENVKILGRIDFTFAKAKLAKDMTALRPEVNDVGRTKLISARHPLIPKDIAVPIDISVGENYRILLVTGPNTGGKTVSMKTLGLLSLMAASGLFLPTAADSVVAIYENIYADIGDEQSIEQSLSTFSAHMTHIVNILENVSERDLLLLDEIGAGTDPDEGAALATSILEKILAIGASAIATTHYSALKTFAYTTDGIENACVEFNMTTLQPTYRLLIGIPGASNAFSISERLGLSKDIISRAKELIDKEHAKFEKVISALEEDKRRYEDLLRELTTREAATATLEAKVKAKSLELSKEKGNIIRKAKEQASALVRKARKESEEIIKALKEQFDDYGVKRRREVMEESRAKLKELSAKTHPGIMAEKGVGVKINPKTIAVGDTVYVAKLNERGTVLSVKGSELEVSVGSLKTWVKSKDCRFLSAAPKENTQPKITHTHAETALSKTAAIERDIDLRGMMVDEAELAVGKFLDDAALAGLSNVLLIHGKGTGALRAGLHSYLKNHAGVSHFALADIDEGGTGATVVTLK
ncbi:MAG: endonuclease MutS2 [Selenomonadaceae bacterium]|nr:endonuclease MutS2 [Selenomonadaceae bacterium]